MTNHRLVSLDPGFHGDMEGLADRNAANPGLMPEHE
jgi:hypothetical protein